MKPALRAGLAAIAVLMSGAVSFAIYIEPTHYEKPPAEKAKPDWPAGLAALIDDKTYVDGWSYANPGYVVEMNDTFFFNGETGELNKFIQKLRATKNLDAKIRFTEAAGWASEFVRAGTLMDGKVMGEELNQLGSKPCSWLITITDRRWAEHSGLGQNAQAQVLIFLGSKKIEAERIEL